MYGGLGPFLWGWFSSPIFMDNLGLTLNPPGLQSAEPSSSPESSSQLTPIKCLPWLVIQQSGDQGPNPVATSSSPLAVGRSGQLHSQLTLGSGHSTVRSFPLASPIRLLEFSMPIKRITDVL